mmetsp:Transcript_3672/g.5144  ORF Transcript_3672/g.5144 Transcript_3672/m.5144 type:complete len:455 (+) Transcript_3672:145-1509(+)
MGACIASCFASMCCECTSCLACCACQGLCNFTLSRAAKFGHLFLAASLFITAEIFGHYHYDIINEIPGVNLKNSCSDYVVNCVLEQLLYRASAAAMCVFFILGLLTPGNPSLHSGWWILKFGLLFGLFFAFWFGENDKFSDYANTARVLALVWLLVQNLLILDASHELHEEMTTKITEEDAREKDGGQGMQGAYVGIGVIGIVSSIVSLGFLYSYYGSCSLNNLLISITLICGILFTVASLLDAVNVGLLPPALLFMYSTFLCWYSLTSADTETCNPDATSVDSAAAYTSEIISTVAVLAMLWWTSWNRTALLSAVTGADRPKKAPEEEKMRSILEGDSLKETKKLDEEAALEEKRGEGPPPDDVDEGEVEKELPNSPEDQKDRMVFHFLLCAGSVFMAMGLTNWGSTDGSPVSVGDSWESTLSFWMKVSTQWILLLMQLRVLYVNWQDDSPPK